MFASVNRGSVVHPAQDGGLIGPYRWDRASRNCWRNGPAHGLHDRMAEQIETRDERLAGSHGAHPLWDKSHTDQLSVKLRFFGSFMTRQGVGFPPRMG